MKRPCNWTQTKQAIRDRYAWPGGYEMHLIMADGEPLCMDCARREFKQIARNTWTPSYGRDWQTLGPDIHWEGSPMHCVNCNTEITATYGDPAEESAT